MIMILLLLLLPSLIFVLIKQLLIHQGLDYEIKKKKRKVSKEEKERIGEADRHR
jgi:hypothetical protein